MRPFRGIKCPVCGELVNEMTAVCPSCKSVLQGSSIYNRDALELIDRINTYIAKLNALESGNSFAKTEAALKGVIRKGKMLYGANPQMAIGFQQAEEELDKAKRRAERKRKCQVTKVVGLAVGNILLFVVGLILFIVNFPSCN